MCVILAGCVWSRLGKQQPPALTFVDNGLVAVLGRQVAGKPVEGFPNGLPALTPLGVRLTIENMLGGIFVLLFFMSSFYQDLIKLMFHISF